MITLLFRKMLNTRWMVLCLLVGFIMAAAMMSTIPIYMDGSLQRMLIKDMQGYQLDTGEYPGEYSVVKKTPFGLDVSQQKQFAQDVIEEVSTRAKAVDMPIDTYKNTVRDDFLFLTVETRDVGNKAVRTKLVGMSEVEDHINIKRGRMYQQGLVDGAYEVIATDAVLQEMEVIEGREYVISNAFDSSLPTFKVRIVGVYEPISETDSYWAESQTSYLNSLILDYDTFINEVIFTGTSSLTDVTVQFAYDYQKMDLNKLSSVVSTIKADSQYYDEQDWTFSMGVLEILDDYAVRAAELKTILWLLQIPVMIMLAFYLFMVSQLNVEQEKNEIAVFKSRGASSKQIFGIYALEGLVLGAITMIIGPLIGLLLCKILGVSNGFLEFVDRPALPVKLSLEALKYAALAVMVFFTTTMLPIIPASKTTIVLHKQKKAKKVKFALWEKMGIDFILIGLSLYWLLNFQNQQKKLIEQGIEDTKAAMDPLVFLASTLFVLGTGLFFIRIYPYLVRLIYKAGKRIWSPAAYVSLSTASRLSGGKERFLMMFLILTVGLGLFSANTARAINTNMDERVSYQYGADMVLKEFWQTNALLSPPSPVETDEEEEAETAVMQYEEPNFDRFLKLPGVKSATKVFSKEDIMVKSKSADTKQANLMAVIPGEFAQIAWFRDDLLPIHWYNYINALSSHPSATIVSKSFADNMGVKLGDKIEVKWGQNNYFDAHVVAFADFWPTFNPYEKRTDGKYSEFMVMNYNYVRIQTNVEPYEVWIDMDEDASSEELYNAIDEQGFRITSIKDTNQQLIRSRNDPQLQGMNGALTLGFIIIMVMTIIGFLIYWILSIKSRTLQFGILRAMGISFREIIAMLLYEQVLISGVAIFIAIIIGGITSDLFVPLFQSMYSVSEQVPPFRVIALRSDYIKVYIIIFAMLLSGFAILGRLISKIKISQAIKLGED